MPATQSYFFMRRTYLVSPKLKGVHEGLQNWIPVVPLSILCSKLSCSCDNDHHHVGCIVGIDWFIGEGGVHHAVFNSLF